MIRTLIETPAAGFVVEVVVEGYRPCKDQWLYERYRFATLEEVKQFAGRLGFGQDDKLLGFGAYTRETGWWGLGVEEVRVYERDGQGREYRIEFEPGELKPYYPTEQQHASEPT